MRQRLLAPSLILALLAGVPAGEARAQATKVTDVGIGRPGDHWVSALQIYRIERATRAGAFGYAITYDVPGAGELMLFWPRAQIHLSGKRPRARWHVYDFGTGRLHYPDVITGASLPRIHAGILRIEEIYRADARGGIAAMYGFALVFGALEGASVVAVSRAAARSVASREGTQLAGRVMLLKRSARSRAARKAANNAGPASAATAESVPATSSLTVSGSGATTTASLATRSAASASRGSPRKLARALVKAGFKRPKGAAVHHIVASNAKGAELARKVLRKLRIDIDDAGSGGPLHLAHQGILQSRERDTERCDEQGRGRESFAAHPRQAARRRTVR